MRERIRLEAFNVYAEGGLEAVSIRAVAHRVGVSPTNIYSFFKSRQALVEALWLDPVLVLLGEMVRVASITPDPVDRVTGLLDLYVDFALLNPEIYRAAFLYVRPAKEVSPNARTLDDLDFQRLLRQAISDGQTVQRITPGDPVILAQALWAGVHGALALPTHMEAWTFADRRQLVAQVQAMLLNGMLSQMAGRSGA